MKKYLLTFIILSLVFLGQTQNDEIIGTWEGNDGDDLAQMTFDKDGYVFFTIDDETIGGPSYDLNGSEASLTYTLDLNKFPHWIDILITLNDDNTVYDVMLGILEFSDDYKEMKICLDFGEGEGRPTSFIPDDTLIMFRRE